MRIGIFTDSHDHLVNNRQALAVFNDGDSCAGHLEGPKSDAAIER